MKWIESFNLFLFDFDGVLVDTEPLHYAAYRQSCAIHGLELPWNYGQFCDRAHGESQGVKLALYSEFPQLLEKGITWEILAEEKRQIYTSMIKEQPVSCMPKVETLLQELQRQGRVSCVVTNSMRGDVELIRASLPILKSIPHWLTREDYTQPKPSPAGYLKAISLYGSSGGAVIGFEDTMKGFKALHQTPAKAVLLCPAHRAHVPVCRAMGGLHFESFEALLSKGIKSVIDLH